MGETLTRPALKGNLDIDDTVRGYICPTCGVSHETYFSLDDGVEESPSKPVATLEVCSELEDKIVSCENGFMMSKMKLVEHNMEVSDKDLIMYLPGDHLYCPACDTKHEGDYIEVSYSSDPGKSIVQCPDGRMMPKDALLSHSHRKLLERIEKRSNSIIRIGNGYKSI